MATATAAATQEPWQITRDEWGGYYTEEFQLLLKEKTNAVNEIHDLSFESANYKRITRAQNRLSRIQSRIEQISNPNYLKRTHKQIISQALSEGKPVPAEVLKDYPELGKKETTSEFTEKATKKIEQAIRNIRRRKYQKIVGTDWSNEGLDLFNENQFAHDLGISPSDLEQILPVKRHKWEYGKGAMWAPTEKELREAIPKLADYLSKPRGYRPEAQAKPEPKAESKAKGKAIETIKADLHNELMRRAKAGERLPVGMSSTDKGIAKYLESLGEGHMRDWHSVIFRKGKPKPKPRREIAVLQTKLTKQSDRALAIDRSLLAKQVVSVDDPRWLKRPNRFDVRGVDTPGSGRVGRTGFTDKGKTRVSRRHHRGWKKAKLA